jgi:site-specific DNA-methyltransferase (adenine-specific)
MTANIYLGDCQQAFEMGKKWDLAIVDPPYKDDVSGLSAGYNRNHFTYQHFQAPTKHYVDQLFLISQNQIIWGFNYFLEVLPNTDSVLIWNKHQTGHFSEAELAWSSIKKTRIFDYAFGRDPDAKNKCHPTQKPVALYKWLLKNYAKPGDTILDTHGGSMSIVIACIEMGFDIDIWEKDPDYFAAARKRIENHVKQLPLFGPVPTINFYT